MIKLGINLFIFGNLQVSCNFLDDHQQVRISHQRADVVIKTFVGKLKKELGIHSSNTFVIREELVVLKMRIWIWLDWELACMELE